MNNMHSATHSNRSREMPFIPAAKQDRSRRQFLQALTRSAAAGVLLAGVAPAFDSAQEKGPAGRKKVAILATEVRKMSHAQHFIDRFLEG